MKKQFLSISFIFSFLTCPVFYGNVSYSQNPLVKQWDYRFGGTDHDHLSTLHQTADGGYILGGISFSDSSGDKTQSSRGSYDFWIVKTDALGNKQWDKRFGGSDVEYLYALQQTADGGYILGGASYSGIGGDKTQPSWGGIDYWIVKTDSLGNYEWDKRYGSTNDEIIHTLEQTNDGGYILGGHSNSGIGGDKTQDTWGVYDYWIVKIDALGNKQWDKDLGGSMSDILYSIHQTADGGYIVGGTSTSGISGDKTQNTWGDADYWIIKISASGGKEWDKDIGGSLTDYLISLQVTADGGYILGGCSLSDISGDKSQNTWGDTDFWIIKTDSGGIKQWDKDFGGTSAEDDFGNVSQTADGGYLIAGNSYSPISGDKTEDNLAAEQTWVLKTDSLGTKQWDKTLFTSSASDDELGLARQTKDGCYVMANYTNAGIGGYKTQSSQGLSDYWIIKFCDSTATTSITQLPNTQLPFSIYPNPADGFITINSNLIAGDEIRITDMLGELLFTTKIKTPVSNFQFSISNLSPGIYFLKAGNEVRKFVKE